MYERRRAIRPSSKIIDAAVDENHRRQSRWRKATVAKVEASRQLVDMGRLGDDIGILLRHEVTPGDEAAVQIQLGVPIGCEVGMHFDVRESNRTVGEGIVTELLD